MYLGSTTTAGYAPTTTQGLTPVTPPTFTGPMNQPTRNTRGGGGGGGRDRHLGGLLDAEGGGEEARHDDHGEVVPPAEGGRSRPLRLDVLRHLAARVGLTGREGVCAVATDRPHGWPSLRCLAPGRSP